MKLYIVIFVLIRLLQPTAMTHRLLFFILFLGLSPKIAADTPPTAQKGRLQAIPFDQVRLQDQFWAPRFEKLNRVTLPHALQKNEPGVENLRRTANFLAGVPDQMPVRSLFLVSDLYKTMEAAAYSLTITPNRSLEARMDSIITLIAAAQKPDGYMYEAHVCGVPIVEDMGARPYERLNLSHELYNMGHLYEAAVAYYKATGKGALLQVAEKHACHVNRVFFEGDPGYNGGKPINAISGHPEIELALCKLFTATSDSLYLKMASRFVALRGDRLADTIFYHNKAQGQEHMPLKDQREPAGHAVCAAYIYAGMSDVDALCGTDTYEMALNSIWDNLMRTRIALTGGLGAVRGIEGFGPPYELPNKLAYNETCASVANVLLEQRLFLTHRDARYLDILECALYNGALAGINLEGDRFFYVNPLEADGLTPFNLGSRGRQPWYGCACCPPNIARLLAAVGSYFYAHTDTDIYCTLYATNRTEISLKEGAVGLEQQSNYPFSGEASWTITPEQPMHFAMRLRIPTWARSGEFLPGGLYTYANAGTDSWNVRVNGKKVKAKLEKGFAVIERRWKPGDRVELSLPLVPRYVQARPEVEADRDRLAVVCGPLVYCAEEADNGLVQRYWLPKPAALSRTSIIEDPLQGLTAVETTAAKLDTTGRMPLRLIPYYAWDNRGDRSMIVWLPRTEAQARESLPTTEKNKSWLREMYLTCKNTREEQEALFDGMVPFRSHHQGYSSWTSRGCESEPQQLEFLFKAPRTLESIAVFWIADARTTTLLPEKWSVEYLDGGEWKSMRHYVTDTYGLELDGFNEVRPASKLRCEGLRLKLTPQPGHSVGIAELQINLSDQ